MTEKAHEPVFKQLLGRAVHVEASGLTLEGRLLHVEPSRHNGFGNIILQTSNGPVLVRGSNIQSIGERAVSPSASAPHKTRKNGGEGKHAVLQNCKI